MSAIIPIRIASSPSQSRTGSAAGRGCRPGESPAQQLEQCRAAREGDGVVTGSEVKA